MPPKIEVFGIIVKEMAPALAFYRALGLAIPPEMDTEAHVDFVLPEGLRLSWDTYGVIQSFDADWQPSPGAHHRLNIGFRCDDAAHVDAVYADLMAKGYGSHNAPWDAVWEQRYAQVLDPDGNVIDLFAPLSM